MNKLQKPTVFFDLDGVLADFDTHARNHGKIDVDEKVKWEELDYNWWATMPSCEGAKEFYNEVRANRELETRILSAPTASEECFSGKAHWVQKFSDGNKFSLLDLMLVAGKDKYRLASPNDILIDDRIKSVLEWREAGGIAIHHKGNFEVTRQELERALADIREHGKGQSRTDRGI